MGETNGGSGQRNIRSVPGNMMETAAAKKAIHFLTISFSSPPTEKMFISVSDFLVARLELENCQHPGPCKTENARLKDLERVQEVEGKFVMKVARHKTSKSGPAPITMTADTLSNVRAYVKYVRPHFVQEDVQELFVTREEKAFGDGTIG